MPTASDSTSKSSSPADDQHEAAASVDNAIVKQSDQPVDVPRTPRPRDMKNDEAKESSHPPKDDSGGSTWADGVKPAPNKRKARSHQF